MIQTRRLTIIPSDNTVVTDDGALLNLDLSTCNIPEDVHALQWNSPVWQTKAIKDQIASLPYGQGTGWIELMSDEPNVVIESLPQWAMNCYYVYESVRLNEQENNQT